MLLISRRLSCCPPLDCLFTSHRPRSKEGSGPLRMPDSSDEDDERASGDERGSGDASGDEDGSCESGDEDDSGEAAGGESGVEDEEMKMKLLKIRKMEGCQEGVCMHQCLQTVCIALLMNTCAHIVACSHHI